MESITEERCQFLPFEFDGALLNQVENHLDKDLDELALIASKRILRKSRLNGINGGAYRDMVKTELYCTAPSGDFFSIKEK